MCGNWRLIVLIVCAVAVPAVLAPAYAGATHVGCGDVLTSDTALDSDLLDCPGSGLFIGADAIEVDLNGHVVDGRRFGSVGVSNIAGHDNATVRNGVVREFASGVWLQGATGNALTGLELRDNTDYGAQVVGGSDNLLEDLLAHSNNLNGIRLDASFRNRILRSDVSRNGTLLDHTTGGILIERSGQNVLDGNTLDANPYNGILFSDRVFTDVDANTVVGNQIRGGIRALAMQAVSDSRVESNVVSGATAAVELVDSQRVTVAANTLTGNRDAVLVLNPNVTGADSVEVLGNDLEDNIGGVFLSNVDGSVVARNRMRHSSAVGIRLRFARDNAIQDNSISDGQWGILSSDSGSNRYERNRVWGAEVDGMEISDSQATVLDNFAVNNGDDGIEVAGGTQTVGGNKANANADLGIEADLNTTDSGGNKAAGNGNPLECLNVSCK